MAGKLTDRQKNVLGFIQQYIEENQYAPSLQEIATEFSFSVSSASSYVQALIRKGFIETTPGIHRSIQCVA